MNNDLPIEEFRLVVEQQDDLIIAAEARVTAGLAGRDELQSLDRLRKQRDALATELEAMRAEQERARAARLDGEFLHR